MTTRIAKIKYQSDSICYIENAQHTSPEIIIKHCYDLNEIRKLNEFAYRVLSSDKYEELYKYLFIPFNFDLLFIEGNDSFGRSMQFEISRPKWWSNKFQYTMYPLTTNGSMFASVRPYDYLTTFNLSTLTPPSNDDEDKIYKAVQRLLAMQSQSRFSSIWRELAAVVLAVDSVTSTYLNPIRLWCWFLIGKYFVHFPFIEKNGEVIFFERDIPSIIPTLLYTLMSVGMDLVLGTVTTIEAYFCIDRYIRLANDSFMDAKLRTKSAMRNWIQEAMNNVKRALCLRWDEFGNIFGIYNKILTEIPLLNQEIKNSILERQEKLDNVDFIYIRERLRLLKSVDDIERFYQLCHAASNDRTYYKTIVELCLDAAVQPQVRESLVVNPNPIVELYDSGNIIMFQYDNERSDAVSRSSRYLNNYVPRMVSKLSGLNMDQEWIRFITTSSAGKKLSSDEVKMFGELAQKFHNRRIFRVAMEMSSYSNKDRLLLSISDRTILVVRQQIDRRQRTIAGLSNPKLEASFPGYIIGKSYYDLTTEAAQGKQTGSILDAIQLLFSTSTENLISNSLDISGMDASIQPGLRKPYDILTLKVAAELRNKRFGPWRDEVKLLRYVTLSEDGTRVGSVRQEPVSALQLAIGFQASTIQTATTYNSDIFGTIVTQEGTFESGRSDTSTHHTVLLSGIMNGETLKRRRDGKVTNFMWQSVMGDDVHRIYKVGPDVSEEIQQDGEALKQCGFKITNDISSNYAVFLQQVSMVGRIIGLPNRVSLLTREHVKVHASLHQAATELNALCDDLISRVKDAKNITILQQSIGLFCLIRHTLKLKEGLHYNFIRDALVAQSIRVQEYIHSKHSGSRLLTIYAPFVWLFCHLGGEFPAPSIVINGNVVLRQQSILCPRGTYKRKMLIDIARAEGLKFNELYKSTFLKDLGFTSSAYLIELKIFDLEKMSRLDDSGMIELSGLAQSLNQLEDQRSLQDSRIGEYQLALRGVHIPKSIIFAHNNYTRLSQLVTSGEVDVLDVDVFSRLFYERAKQLRNFGGIKSEANDVYYDYIVDISTTPVEFLSMSKFTYECPFLTCMSGGNFYWYVHSLLGSPLPIEGKLKRDIASIRGKFHNFRYSDPVFEEGLKIFKRDKSLLDYYYDAIHLRERERVIFTDALQYFSRFGDVNVKYITSPRQLFALSDNPERLLKTYVDVQCVEDIVDERTGYPSVVGLIATYAFLHLLESNYYPTVNKINIVPSCELIKALRY